MTNRASFFAGKCWHPVFMHVHDATIVTLLQSIIIRAVVPQDLPELICKKRVLCKGTAWKFGIISLFWHTSPPNSSHQGILCSWPHEPPDSPNKIPGK